MCIKNQRADGKFTVRGRKNADTILNHVLFIYCLTIVADCYYRCFYTQSVLMLLSSITTRAATFNYNLQKVLLHTIITGLILMLD